MEIRIKIPDLRIKKSINSWWNKVVASLTVSEAESTENVQQQVPVDHQRMEEEVNEFLASRQKFKARRAQTKPTTDIKPLKASIRLQKEDLPLISTALVRYKKHLAQCKQMEKATRVGELDELFYKMIKNDRQVGHEKEASIKKEQLPDF